MGSGVSAAALERCGEDRRLAAAGPAPGLRAAGGHRQVPPESLAAGHEHALRDAGRAGHRLTGGAAQGHGPLRQRLYREEEVALCSSRSAALAPKKRRMLRNTSIAP